MSRWTREDLLLALGLYFETAFGKQHKTHPPIVELAGAISRTPSSVAMKLNNFTSIDPSEAERGIKGLTGASKLDRVKGWGQILICTFFRGLKSGRNSINTNNRISPQQQSSQTLF